MVVVKYFFNFRIISLKKVTFLFQMYIGICLGQSEWNAITPPPQNSHLYSVIYDNGQFVAVGLSSILTSPNAITWTARNTGRVLFSVAYGNSQYVAVGWFGLILTFFSDATTWTTIKPLNTNISLFSVTHGNGQFVAIGDSGTIYTAINDTSWVKKNSGTNALNSITYGNGQFVAVGDIGIIMTSPDATIWTTKYSSASLNSITYGQDHQFVAVGRNGTILASPDAKTWRLKSSGITNSLASVTYGNNQYVAVGDTGVLLTSLDATIWTKKNSNTTEWLRSITYGNGYFVAVGLNGTILTSKADSAVASIQPWVKKADKGEIKLNIANKYLSIFLPNITIYKQLKVKIFTIAGKRIFSSMIGINNGIFNIPTSGYPTGMYCMSIMSDNGTWLYHFYLEHLSK